jgi:hypothetical protein
VLQLLVTANVAPSSVILFTLMMEAIRSSETSSLTRATRRHIPEDGILRPPVVHYMDVLICESTSLIKRRDHRAFCKFQNFLVGDGSGCGLLCLCLKKELACSSEASVCAYKTMVSQP